MKETGSEDGDATRPFCDQTGFGFFKGGSGFGPASGAKAARSPYARDSQQSDETAEKAAGKGYAVGQEPPVQQQS